MSINKYEPHSHFFVDHNNLYNHDDSSNSGSITADAFGPVVGNETTQYRTTSFVRASATSKVLAICDGHILIQPYDGDNTKVNLIIKPTVSYAPLKIKYFIYRGVDKDDLIFGFDIAQQTPDSPEFIKRVWEASNNLAEALDQPLPLNLDAKFIGYDPSLSDDELLSYVFFGGGTVDFNLYNISKCFKGELIGNFTEKIGFDIVLDYGNYELDYEEQLFKLDLKYARKPEHILDVSTIKGAIKQKRYKEYIHQFIDASAFWGSHIDCGEILLYNNTDPKTDAAGIYPLVSKYQTANKLYLYIQAERGRSYNYFGEYPTNNISFELQGRGTTFLPYTTEGVWPILIKSFTRTTITGVTIGIKNIENSNLINIDKHRATYIRASNWERDSLINHSTTTDTSIFNYTVRITNNSANQITIANMILIHHLGNENQLYPYYNQTFGLVNIKATIYDTDSLTDGYKLTLNNINPKLLTTNSINRFRSAIINTKVIFDKGKKSNSSSTKNRRLYISKIVDLSQEDSQYITSTPISKYVEENNESYYLDLYGSTDFKIYKGELNDSSAIQTLTLVNSKNLLLKQSYFHLGILEEEYNKLMYNSLVIPDPLPSPVYIPKDAVNIRFYMEEDSSNINDYENKDYRRFKLGVNYENNTGNLEHKFPSSPIFIYTIDGFFFFSSGYSEYQDIFKTFSKSSVHFRPLENWRGDYGFDWIRIGDYEIDTSIENIKYFNILGHYYDNSIPPKKNPNEPEATATFLKEKVEWQTFHRLYPSYAKLKTINPQLNTYSQYASSYLTLYPSLDINDNPLPFPKESTSLTQKCFTERFIGLNVHIDDSQTSLKIRFETKHFDINSIPLSTTTEIPDSIDPEKYTCLQINENEMEGNKWS